MTTNTTNSGAAATQATSGEASEREKFQRLFADIHPAGASHAANLFERTSDESRYCSFEVEYAWQTYRATAPAPAAPAAGQRSLTEEVQFLRNVVNDATRMLRTSNWPKTADLLESATACVERAALAAAQEPAAKAEPVAVVNADDDGLFVEILYGQNGSPLKIGDKLYAAPVAQSDDVERDK